MNANILIAGLICLSSVFQQEEPLSKVANIKIPEKARRITVEQVEPKLSKEFKYGKRAASGMKNVFETDGVIVAFDDLSASVGIDKLEDRQASELHTIREMGGEVAAGLDETKIVMINNIKFYILKRHVKDEYFYSFVSERKDHKGIYGSVIFKKEKKENAEKVFEHLLKSISFKKK